MKKYKLMLVGLLVSLLFSFCSVQKGYVKFTSKPNEIIATPMIKDYMKQHSKPTIVLKAPNTDNKSTQSDPNSFIYTAIEKELLIAGLDVRDRSLFNEVMGKTKEINYSEIKELTGTDLMLELVRLSRDIEYGTNRYFRKNGVEKVVKNHTFRRYGAVAEFKLTLVEKNQYAGSYSFYYTPCTEVKEDCECEVVYKKGKSKIYPELSFCRGVKNSSILGYEYVSENIMENFVRNGVKQMIDEIKK